MGANYRGPDDESIFERNKEVDEWLIGSGESDATAGSNNEKAAAMKMAAMRMLQKAKQNELERPVQPMGSSDEEDGCEDDDDWMF